MTDKKVMQMALDALIIAEAGLSDIGDADREPSDDLAWCKARAAQALACPRAAITVLRAAIAQPEQTAPLDLKALVQKVHKAKGRHHSQIAMCDLYDACGLPNVRPGAESAQPEQPAVVARGAEIATLREALESIERYGLDTLSGRTDGPDDRNWQRQGVNEMTKRAQSALYTATNIAQPEQTAESDDLTIVYMSGFADGKKVAQQKEKRNGQQAIDSLQQAIAQPEQEPNAWRVSGTTRLYDQYDAEQEAKHCGGTTRAYPVYAKPQSVHAATEKNFCSRCGKRSSGIDDIHTCTPPAYKETN